MKSKMIVLLMGSLAATSGWTADRGRTPKPPRADKEETIGVGSGLAIGALAGGPIGLIVGAAFGGWIGDRMHHEKTGRAVAEARVSDEQVKTAALKNELTGSQLQVAQLDAQLRGEQVAHRRDLEEALSVDVLFRTEDNTVDAATEGRLAQLAALVGPMEGAVIHVEGHADARGTVKFNSVLSESRAGAVRDALIRSGVPAERILVSATGETDAVASETDRDGMALERRVQVSIANVDGTNRVAQQN